jgi:hypothetical protein
MMAGRCSAMGVVVFALASGCPALGALLVAVDSVPVKVDVDCAEVIGPRAYPERYQNNSILHVPPLALAERVAEEFGKPKITRCWLQLGLMWNRTADSYDFNFKIPRRVYDDELQIEFQDGTASTQTVLEYENFEDYLNAFSSNSEAVLLNVRDLQNDVLNGVITMDKWKEVLQTSLRHYKERYPNIQFIEVLNESRTKSFGGLTDDQYYMFYQAAYDVVNRLNDELNPAVPLLVGGPLPSANISYDASSIRSFFTNYANDTNPAKRLDFFSVHQYNWGLTPSSYSKFDVALRDQMRQAGLPADLPIFITETGFGTGLPTPDPERNLTQAAALTTFEFYARHRPNLYIFPWVIYHKRQQLCFVQFTQDMTMTPFGAAVKAWSLQKENEIGTEVQRENSELGVYAAATLDDTGVAVMVWNYQAGPGENESTLPEPAWMDQNAEDRVDSFSLNTNGWKTAAARVAVRNLPEKWQNATLKVRQYLIDSKHSNCFAENTSGGGRLEEISCVEVKAGEMDQLTVRLEPNAICLWILEESGAAGTP